MQIIGVTGLPGSGKSLVARIAKQLGMEVIRMGDVIRDEANKRNADIGETAVNLRLEYGEYVIAQKCVEKMKNVYNSSNDCELKFLIEGIRSPSEVEIFKKELGNIKVIAIHSSPKTRFMRLRKRRRVDDFDDESEFLTRDERELKFGIGNVIARADYMIVNEGPIWKYKNSIRQLLKNKITN